MGWKGSQGPAHGVGRDDGTASVYLDSVAKRVAQELKPFESEGLIGMTKVMPFYKAFWTEIPHQAESKKTGLICHIHLGQ